MQKLIILTLLVFLLATPDTRAQTNISFAAADSQSYALYEKAQWKTLLQYGKEAIANGQDFVLLRMRMGYAAFMLGNYSESIKHYEVVLKKDTYNSTAHYYIYWSRVNLNQPEIAMAEVKFLSPGMIGDKNSRAAAFTNAAMEVSLKQASVISRGNPLYFRVALGHRFSHGFHMQQSVATYRQKINEPLLTAVAKNNNININQVEYYNRVMMNLNRNWQLKAAYHYVYTPFNNFIYHNHLLLAGVKYNGTYLNLQADAIIGKITDISTQQYNIQLDLYPLGNLNLYSFSTASLRQQKGSAFNFRQVIGVKLLKQIWLEGNITIGEFKNYAENDALYVYNSIDINKQKAGLTGYISLNKKLSAQLGYTFEQLQLLGTTSTFNQHSITGGLSWKF
ncbi:MAG: hypothetical protein IPL50_17850 [Chitinophagaceae bacterium]|nr:hypothetical protein [Chitinophagaceae bacterium]